MLMAIIFCCVHFHVRPREVASLPRSSGALAEVVDPAHLDELLQRLQRTDQVGYQPLRSSAFVSGRGCRPLAVVVVPTRWS
jgi:hypothetical protein